MPIKRRPDAGIWYHYTRLKSRAKGRGVGFGLSFEQFMDLATQSCTYCGEPPHALSPRKVSLHADTLYNATLNGLDRVDSSKGYVWGNVVPCCPRCNAAKNDMTFTQFKSWLAQAFDHLLGGRV